MSSAAGTDAVEDPRDAMERMYRHQRFIYDASRKFYLLGRDRVLDGLPLSPGERVCEIGCGTARNLVRLGKRHPDVQLYGVDASAPMLASARLSLARAGLDGRVTLHHGLAEDFDAGTAFGLPASLDVIIFAYSLSMIPKWRAAVVQAVANLKRGGRIAIVDFGDQHDLPGWFANTLRAWLSLFHVEPREELPAWLEAASFGPSVVKPLFGGYAVEMHITKAA